jgi:hypothetical protein
MHAESGSRLTAHLVPGFLARLGALLSPRRRAPEADLGAAVRRAFPDARPFVGADGSVDRSHWVLRLD